MAYARSIGVRIVLTYINEKVVGHRKMVILDINIIKR